MTLAFSWLSSESTSRLRGSVALPEPFDSLSEVAGFGVEVAEAGGMVVDSGGEIFDSGDDHVRDAAPFFKLAMGDPGGATARDLVMTFPDFLLDDQITGPCFVLERHERDALGRRGALPQDH